MNRLRESQLREDGILRRRASVSVFAPMAIAFTVFLSGCGAVSTQDPADADVDSGGGLPQEIIDAGEIVLATGQNTVPTHFIEDGELVGFNVDIATALGKRLGVDIKLVQVPFDSVLAGVQAGRFDTALYNVSRNDERQDVVDFVDYANSGSVVVTRRDETQGITTDPLSLCGHSVGLTSGLYEFQILDKEVSPQCEDGGKNPIDLQTYDSDSDVRQALLSGRIDGFVDGLTATPYLVSENEDTLELVGKLPIAADPLGMPFAKDRTQLVEAFQTAWNDVYTSGEYEELADRWELEALVPESEDFFVINGGEGV